MNMYSGSLLVAFLDMRVSPCSVRIVGDRDEKQGLQQPSSNIEYHAETLQVGHSVMAQVRRVLTLCR